MLLFSCRKCGVQAPSLEGHKCIVAASDLKPAVVAPTRLEQARAALARIEAPVVTEAFKEAAVAGRAFVQGGRLLKREEVLAPAKEEPGFDRNAYHKAYMKAYMRGYRARKRGAKPTS